MSQVDGNGHFPSTVVSSIVFWRILVDLILLMIRRVREVRGVVGLGIACWGWEIIC